MLFLYLFFLHCFQLKLILMPNWLIWGWHILLHATVLGESYRKTDRETETDRAGRRAQGAPDAGAFTAQVPSHVCE